MSLALIDAIFVFAIGFCIGGIVMTRLVREPKCDVCAELEEEMGW